MSALVAAGLAAAAVLLTGRGRGPAAGLGPPVRRPPVASSGGPAGSRGRGAVVVGATAALVVLLLAPVFLAPVAPVAGFLAWRHARRLEPAAVRRHREAVGRELPHLVDLLRAMVAAGAPPDRAVAAAAEVVSPATAHELRPWTRRLHLGSDPAQVWEDLSRHPELGRLGTTLHRAVVSGAAVGDALQRLGDDLRSSQRADVHRRVRQVEVRATGPLGACLLPAFVLLGVVPLVAGAAQSLTTL